MQNKHRQPQPLQVSYRDYLDDIRRQVRWVHRIMFRRAIRQAIPGLLQQGAPGETLLAVLAARCYISPSATTMDSDGVTVHDVAESCVSSLPLPQRSLFALTSHCLHAFPLLGPMFTTFVPDQLPGLWRINNGLRTIEIPFLPPNAVERLKAMLNAGDMSDPGMLRNSLVLRVDSRDWVAANSFWAAGLLAASHWGDAAAIVSHMQSMRRGNNRRE